MPNRKHCNIQHCNRQHCNRQHCNIHHDGPSDEQIVEEMALVDVERSDLQQKHGLQLL